MQVRLNVAPRAGDTARCGAGPLEPETTPAWPSACVACNGARPV